MVARLEGLKYPLLRDYDFSTVRFERGGSGTLLIPNRTLFVPIQYGFGELSVVPNLQTHFNAGQTLELEDLIRELDKYQKQMLVSETGLDGAKKDPVLYRTLRNFDGTGIVKMEDIIGSEDLKGRKNAILSKGKNYDKVRVYSLR